MAGVVASSTRRDFEELDRVERVARSDALIMLANANDDGGTRVDCHAFTLRVQSARWRTCTFDRSTTLRTHHCHLTLHHTVGAWCYLSGLFRPVLRFRLIEMGSAVLDCE